MVGKKKTRSMSVSGILASGGSISERTKGQQEPDCAQVKSKNGGTDGAFKQVRDVEDGAITTESNDQIDIFLRFRGMREILFD